MVEVGLLQTPVQNLGQVVQICAHLGFELSQRMETPQSLWTVSL